MKIKVEPLLPTGNYLNVRIGIERDIPDDDNAMEAIFMEWDNIIAMHMKRYPHLYKDGKPLYEMYQGEEPERQIKEPEPKLTKEEKQKKLITDTKCIDGFDGLDSYKLLVKNNDHLKPVFDDHMKYLLNGKYRILDKNGSEMPDHYSGEPRTYEQAKKMLEGLNNNGEFKPYRMEIINQ